MKALYREDLNKTGCSTPSCGHDHNELTFHSLCHPESPTWTTYNKEAGTFAISCSRCDKTVALVNVASKLPDDVFSERVH
jgi:hypothetical protein